MFEPLNPVLFQLLEREFGEVIPVGEGEALLGSYEYFGRDKAMAIVSGRAERSGGNSKPSLIVDHSGEEYKINCFLCNDTRHRLFINHRWGVEDLYGNRNLWLAQCWNEGCLSSYTSQMQLWDRVFRLGRRPPGAEQVRRGHKIDVQALGKALPPGPTIRLDALRRQSPNHAAVAYLEQRGFDVDYLAKMFDVGYCAQARYPLASERIYIPIRMDKRLRGWQMRMVRERRPGDPPKYWSMPNMRRRLLAYNYDQAVQYVTPVIVEGPADVWSYGQQAMGCIGKSMNAVLIRRLLQRCGDESAVVMLDPNPDEKAKAKMGERYVHHIDRLVKALTGKHGFRKGVAGVYLPLDTDPGSLDRAYMRDYIAQAAQEQGVPVSFKRRTL